MISPTESMVPVRPPMVEGYDFNERPFLVFWEITRACALACSHCRAEAIPHRNPNELDTDQAKHLIDQLLELAPPMLIVTGGDPLMRRDALELVRYAADRGQHVGLSPSATELLLRTDFAEIKAAGVQRMSLSLDGATRETHDAFRKVVGTFDRTMEAVRRAHEVGLSLQINTTLTKSNLHEYEDFKKLMYELKPAMWSLFLLIPTGRGNIDELPDADDLERIFEDMASLVGKAPFGVKTTEGQHFRRVLIQQRGAKARAMQKMRSPLGIRDGRGVMFISHTGVVSPSGFLPIECGNVREQHPAKIYREHPVFVSLRDSDALKGKCGVCEFRNVCGGSRARAYGVYGDPLETDPSCNYVPKNFHPEDGRLVPAY